MHLFNGLAFRSPLHPRAPRNLSQGAPAPRALRSVGLDSGTLDTIYPRAPLALAVTDLLCIPTRQSRLTDVNTLYRITVTNHTSITSRRRRQRAAVVSRETALSPFFTCVATHVASGDRCPFEPARRARHSPYAIGVCGFLRDAHRAIHARLPESSNASTVAPRTPPAASQWAHF